MSKIAELVAAAAELNAMELKELRLEIQRLEHAGGANAGSLDGFAVGLTRLDDGEYLKLRRSSIAIEDDNALLVQLLYPISPRPRQPEPLNFAEAQFVLEQFYGESSLHVDDYKGAFSFPFALDVIRGEQSFPYLFVFYNYGDSFAFALRRCIGRGEKTDNIVHPPFENEFARKEINSFVAFFYGHLVGGLKALLASGAQPTPFVHRVKSRLILCGYCDGRFFETQYQRAEEYDEAYRVLLAKVSQASAELP
jgi:hypothetical protein